MANVAEIVTKIRAYAEQSAACQQMAVDTAGNAERAAEFASQGEAIAEGYDSAIEYVKAGNYTDAAEALEGVRSLEAAGGDDQHARRAMAALDSLRTEDAWWAWHDADSSRWSPGEDSYEATADAKRRCEAWVSGESDDGPSVEADRASEIIAALSAYDRGDGCLGIMVRAALRTNPNATIDEIRDGIVEAEEDAALEREVAS